MYKILIVDDESIEREGISFLIEKYKLPLEVAQATNGKTALEYMRTHPIDILLTDVKMPQMDGLELARHTFEKYPDVRILVFSAYGEFEFAKKAMAAQAVSYLLKPSRSMNSSALWHRFWHGAMSWLKRKKMSSSAARNIVNSFYSAL
jgi:two-component system response regulator YesN